MTNIEIVPVEFVDKDALWDDLQDYIDGMKTYDVIARRADLSYEYKDFGLYWQREDYWPFWALAGEARAGFALLHRHADGAMVMAEFYVKQSFRGKGIGANFARKLLAHFPGGWIISMYVKNENSVKLWLGVSGDYHPNKRDYTNCRGKPRLELRFTAPCPSSPPPRGGDTSPDGR